MRINKEDEDIPNKSIAPTWVTHRRIRKGPLISTVPSNIKCVALNKIV